MVAYTCDTLRRFTTSTLSKTIIPPPLVPQGMPDTASVCTVTCTSAKAVITGTFTWKPGREMVLSSAPPRQYTPTYPSFTLCSP